MSETFQANGAVLVVGAGFIGSHLCHFLRDDDRPVRALTRSASPRHEDLRRAGVDVVVADARDHDHVTRALDGVDHVVFGAGGLMPAESNKDPVSDVVLALQPLLTVLAATIARPGTALTYLSSGGTVYGRPQQTPIPETHPTEPITSYGILKLAGEKYVALHGELHGLPTRILRVGNVYGPGQPADRSQGVVAAFLDRVQRGADITMFGNGTVVRDFVHATDVCRAVRDLPPTTIAAERVVNVGSGHGTSLAALLRTIEERLQVDAKVVHLPAREFDVPSNVLDISRMQALCNLAPISLADGLRQMPLGPEGLIR